MVSLLPFFNVGIILSTFSVVWCASSSLPVSPSPVATSLQQNATQNATVSATDKIGIPSNAVTKATSTMATPVPSIVVGTRSHGLSFSSIIGSGQLSPSASKGVAGSSASTGVVTLDQYLQTLPPQQRKVVEDFDMTRKQLVGEMEINEEVKPLERVADLQFINGLERLLTESQSFGSDFMDQFDANVNFEVIDKSNALLTKRIDCLKTRKSTFPEKLNVKTSGASSNQIDFPLDCPREIIKESRRRRRRDVEMSIEMDIEDFPATLDDEIEDNMYRYIRTRRNAQASQNNTGVCLQNSKDQCLDQRLNATVRIWNEAWKPSYSDQTSNDFKSLTGRIKQNIEETVRKANGSLTASVHSFKLSSGSVVATFFADTYKSKANDLETFLKGASTFGPFQVNQSLSVVRQVDVEHGGWTEWTSWASTDPATIDNCGTDFKVNRTRSCTKPRPTNGGRECTGASVEYKSCKFGGTLNSGSSISSPYWSESLNYPSNAEGFWTLVVPFNHTVELTFTHFHLESDKKCFYDYIQVFDGNSTDDKNLLLRACGTDALNKTVKSTKTMMLVKFRSDRTVTEKGFYATWTKKVVPWKPPKPIRYKHQSVTVTNVISCPTFNDSLVPLGKATTCTSSNSDCFPDVPAYLLTCIVGIKTNRTDLPAKNSKITMTFKHIMHKDLFPTHYLATKSCATWNSSSKEWSKKGCAVLETNITHTLCQCEKTGVFAVLSVEKVVHKTLTLLANTYAGIGVSFFILVIAILHIVWKVDVHGGEAMRINMCVAIILMMMTFLIGANVKAEQHLCGFLAFLEYFSVVAQFFWLMLHGLRIHGKIKEIFASGLNIEVVYVAFGWGLPLLLSLIAIGIQVKIKNHNEVCWTAIAGSSMWGYGAPLLIVIMLNVLVLCAVVVPTEERKTKYFYYPMMYRMMKDATLLALFGFTCLMAYQSVHKESFMPQYFLTVSVVLQAVAMIVFGREGRKDYVRRDLGKMQHDNVSENTNELSFGRFEDESSSNRSSRNSNKDPSSPEKKGVKQKSSKFQETDIDAC